MFDPVIVGVKAPTATLALPVGGAAVERGGDADRNRRGGAGGEDDRDVPCPEEMVPLVTDQV